MTNPIKLEIEIACPEDFSRTAMAAIIGTEVFELLSAMFRKEWAEQNIRLKFSDFKETETSEIPKPSIEQLDKLFNTEMVARILE